MIDFRSWLKHQSEFNHWVGVIAREVVKSGWTGHTPGSLRQWLETRGAPADRVNEVQSLELFYSLYRTRERRFSRA